ncbi:MAG: FGGY-family carbohydrate kinase [Butyrivibrio sp.]|nr:FGGY-family carbohydrate kinase [Butyrivibrio sp.]
MGDTGEFIRDGRAVLGIEFGSTRIKAVLTDGSNSPIASGSHEWENRLENGIWTYGEEDITEGLASAYAAMADDARSRYGAEITSLAAMGVSGMMHGYIALDENDRLLVPFRTWRNTVTGEASRILTEELGFHIPQRWSIAHLYQAILNGEEHIGRIKYLTTLAGYIHYRLTGVKAVGIGEASGMFPIDSAARSYNAKMLSKFNALAAERGFTTDVSDILPAVLTAGECAGTLTGAGAALLDKSGRLEGGVRLCPPEGDAGTGMTATDSVDKGTGNVSAGTSVFAMVVLEKGLERVHDELDLVTTPDGSDVAMVHCNNCTSDLNAWAGLFGEFARAAGMELSTDRLFEILYSKALEGQKDCGKMMAFNYFSGEHITGFEEGRPLFVRTPDSRLGLADFMRTHLYASLGALKVGLDILFKEEKVRVRRITGHGGLFKTPLVGQKILAAAMNAPVTVLETAGEGGAWGIALLASYMINKRENETLGAFLERAVFDGMKGVSLEPDAEDAAGFDAFMERYRAALPAERAAVDCVH